MNAFYRVVVVGWMVSGRLTTCTHGGYNVIM